MSLYCPWWEDLDNKYHPKYSGKFPKGSKIEALTDLSAWGGTVIGEIYTVLGYNKYGTVYLEELDYRKSGYGVNNFKLVEDKMSNKELLDYAVENIPEWLDDKWTHLRSDNSAASLFWSKGEPWKVGSSDGLWYIDSSDPSFFVISYTFKTKTAQVITKQEYLDAKEKHMKESTYIERDGKYNLEVTGEQLAWLRLITGESCDSKGLFTKVEEILRYKDNILPDRTGVLTDSGMGFDAAKWCRINSWLDKFFTKPISIEEKRIQELTDTINKAQAEIEKAQEQIKGLKKV